LIWVDDWEQCVIDGKITNEEFLTKTTVEGIRDPQKLGIARFYIQHAPK